MHWLLATPGLMLVAFGGWAGAQSVVSFGNATAIVAVGVLWVGVIAFVVSVTRKQTAIRRAFAAVDPVGAARYRTLRRLDGLLWAVAVLLVLGAPMVVLLGGPGPHSIVVTGTLLAAMLAVVVYRLYFAANLDAAAGSAWNSSFSGAAPQSPSLGKIGTGIASAALFVLVVGAVLVDELARLPFKVVPLIWYALGALVIWCVVTGRWYRRHRRESPPDEP